MLHQRQGTTIPRKDMCSAVLLHNHGLTMCELDALHNDIGSKHSGACPVAACHNFENNLAWTEMFEVWTKEDVTGKVSKASGEIRRRPSFPGIEKKWKQVRWGKRELR